MHLFEAFLALYDATGDAKYLARAGELFALFQSRFFCPQRQVLFEFFYDDWTRCGEARAAVVEPGYVMGLVRLLAWYRRRPGRLVKRYTDALYNKALEIGVDKSGLLFDAVTADGRVLDHNKRCWGLTEFIKANLVQIRAGDPKATERAVKGVDDLFTY